MLFEWIMYLYILSYLRYNLRDRGIKRPIYCGVGISTCYDVLMAKKANADAVFVGSAILKLHNDLPSMIKRIENFKSCCI